MNISRRDRCILHRSDSTKDFRDKAIAVKAFAKQAKDKQLEIDAAEARLRSERRLGELMQEMPKASGAKGNSRNQYAKRGGAQ